MRNVYPYKELNSRKYRQPNNKIGRRLELGYFTEEDLWIANKHRKKYSTSSVTKEIGIKTTMRYHYIPVEWLHFKGLIIPSVGKDVRELDICTLLKRM